MCASIPQRREMPKWKTVDDVEHLRYHGARMGLEEACGQMAELADAQDSKSCMGNHVRVRFPLWPPTGGLTRSSSTYMLRHIDAGWSSLVARVAHNHEVVGSNPAPATSPLNGLRPFREPQESIDTPSVGFCLRRAVARLTGPPFELKNPHPHGLEKNRELGYHHTAKPRLGSSVG